MFEDKKVEFNSQIGWIILGIDNFGNPIGDPLYYVNEGNARRAAENRAKQNPGTPYHMFELKSICCIPSTMWTDV